MINTDHLRCNWTRCALFEVLCVVILCLLNTVAWAQDAGGEGTSRDEAAPGFFGPQVPEITCISDTITITNKTMMDRFAANQCKTFAGSIWVMDRFKGARGFSD